MWTVAGDSGRKELSISAIVGFRYIEFRASCQEGSGPLFLDRRPLPDGGKTWEKGFQQLDARRIGPPRSMGPLAPAKKLASTG
jgi:hypothetical protein